LRVLRRLMGTYAMVASLDMFLDTKLPQHSEELAQLPGVWLVIATEAEKGRTWNESKIKAITGGDPMRARHMRKDSFEFQPKSKVVTLANDQPSLKSADIAMKRRLQMPPWSVIIPEAEVQGDLEDRLVEEEGPQILAWVLEGFEQWREHGLSSPEKVIAASEEYFEEQDQMAEFVAECCDVGIDFQDYSTPGFERCWTPFAKARGYFVGSKKTFVQNLMKYSKEHGFGLEKMKGRSANGFYGIRFKLANRSTGYDDV